MSVLVICVSQRGCVNLLHIMSERTKRAMLMIAFALPMWSSVAVAEPFNINCTVADGSSAALLTVRESLGGIISPNRFLSPTISVVSGGALGETSRVEVKTYTPDKIVVGLSVELETFIHRDSEFQITMDRNTGAAHFDFFAPWEQTKTGVRYRLTVSSSDGRCDRQAPRF